MDLGFYFSSPLKMGMCMGIPELYRFEFGESKIHIRPALLPSLVAACRLPPNSQHRHGRVQSDTKKLSNLNKFENNIFVSLMVI
jgi:hypothetical protein